MLIYNELTRDVDYAIKHSTDAAEENDVDSRVGGSSMAQVRGPAKKKSEITMEVGLTRNFFFCGKSSKNSPKPVVIFWSSIPCVFCL